jgi:predicted PurR-regulated permease PerM
MGGQEMEIVYLIFFLVALCFIVVMYQLHQVIILLRNYLHNIQEDQRDIKFILNGMDMKQIPVEIQSVNIPPIETTRKEYNLYKDILGNRGDEK